MNWKVTKMKFQKRWKLQALEWIGLMLSKSKELKSRKIGISKILNLLQRSWISRLMRTIFRGGRKSSGLKAMLRSEGDHLDLPIRIMVEIASLISILTMNQKLVSAVVQKETSGKKCKKWKKSTKSIHSNTLILQTQSA